MSKVQVIEQSRSVFITWDFGSLGSSQRWLRKIRGAKCVSPCRYVRNLYGEEFLLREYQDNQGTRFLVKESI